jgi:hypothetical protein
MTGIGKPKHSNRKFFQSPIFLHMTRSGLTLIYTVVQEPDWAPGPVWTSAKNLTPSGIRSPDRSFRNESLYLPSALSQPTTSTLNLINYEDLSLGITPRSLVHIYRRSTEICDFIIRVDNGGTRSYLNIGIYIPEYLASHSTSEPSSWSCL